MPQEVTLVEFLKDGKFLDTVFPHIVAAATILFWKLECGNYSREESIQGRKQLISLFFAKLIPI